MYSEEATKNVDKSPNILKLLSNVKLFLEISSYFCGLLRKSVCDFGIVVTSLCTYFFM